MEQFRNALVTKYYRNADGIVLVFDITKRESFEGLDNWISEVRQYCEHGIEKIKMVLIGNKVDRQHQRKVCVRVCERGRERERGTGEGYSEK
jgi:GTPase SAR1 family protein